MFDNETLRVIKQRRSVRSFKDKQIGESELNTVIEAGVYAPSGSGNIENFIHFTVVQNREMLNKINDLAKQFAVQTQVEHLAALGANKEFNCMYDAPTLIIISYNKDWIQPETDCAAAAQNMLLAAESIGLGGCWLYFPLQAFHSSYGNELLKELCIPDEFKPVQSMVLGYKNNENMDTPKREIKNINVI
jgi:nitroreductase